LVRITFYESQNNNAGVYGEALRALWHTVWFDNLFYGTNSSEVYYDDGAGHLDFSEQQKVYTKYISNTGEY